MLSTHFPRLALAVLCALAACTAVGADAAWAADTMPNLVGQGADASLDQLEALGLNVHVITIAGERPGIVAWQDPPAGQSVQSGDEVVLHIGVAAVVQTVAPRVIGMTEDEVYEALVDAYFLEISYGAGPASMEGRVASQSPEPGQQLPHRGRFKVTVVRNASQVPLVVGQPEAQARQQIEDAGFQASVRYVPTASAAQGTVIAQVPDGGANAAPGTVVELTVAGTRGPDTARIGGRHRVAVPNLVGMSMEDAERLVFSLGLTPHVHLQPVPGRPDWSVISQEVAPNSRLPEGSDLGYVVAKPARLPSTLRIPNFNGVPESVARDVLGHMGLSVRVQAEVSTLKPGTILGQRPAPGTLSNSGTEVLLRVAVAPTDRARIQPIVVPSLLDLTVVEARQTLLDRGLGWRMEREMAADRPVERIVRQEPGAGLTVPLGSEVAFYLPLRATVPNLLGLTHEQALDVLERAGLQGVADTQPFGRTAAGGLTEVNWQQVPASSVLARGSLVRFRFRIVTPQTPMIPVPSVVGLTREDAQARLAGAGFGVTLRAASIGRGQTQVVGQTPGAGSLQPAGSTVVVTYRFVGISLSLAPVPNVMGRSHLDASIALQSAGFTVSLVTKGPIARGARTEVIAQSPLAGTLSPRGATVRLTYRTVASVQPGPFRPGKPSLVTVPSVRGLHYRQAVDRLRSVGLNVRLSGPPKYVRDQMPKPGSLVPRGTTVTLRTR